jgi:hypothetical protein
MELRFSMQSFVTFRSLLDATGVQHHSDPAADGLRGQVAPERAPDDSVASVGPAHLPPVDSELPGLVLGDEGDPLPEVEPSVLGRVAALYFDEGNVHVLRPERPLVAEDRTVHVQPRSASRNHC